MHCSTVKWASSKAQFSFNIMALGAFGSNKIVTNQSKSALFYYKSVRITWCASCAQILHKLEYWISPCCRCYRYKYNFNCTGALNTNWNFLLFLQYFNNNFAPSCGAQSEARRFPMYKSPRWFGEMVNYYHHYNLSIELL